MFESAPAARKFARPYMQLCRGNKKSGSCALFPTQAEIKDYKMVPQKSLILFHLLQGIMYLTGQLVLLFY